MLEVIVNGLIGAAIGTTFGAIAYYFVSRSEKRKPKRETLGAMLGEEPRHSSHPEIMVKLLPASNGRILEVSTKLVINAAQNHWEWQHEMFIVREDQSLSEAISLVLLLKGLQK